jgi:hypothetical protein
MSLVECKKEVAQSAKVCPHCGVKDPWFNEKEKKKANKGCFITIGIIILIGIVSSLFESWFDNIPDIDLPHAKPYVVFEQGEVWDGFEFYITANDKANPATTREEFAQTSMKAVINLLEEEKVNFVRVVLYEKDESDTTKNPSEFILSYATFDKVKDKWDINTKKRRLNLEERTMALSWSIARKRYIEDGVVNEKKLKTFLLTVFQTDPAFKNNPVSKYTDIKQMHLPYGYLQEYDLPEDN